MTNDDEVAPLTPEEASLVAASINFATRDVVALQSGVLTNVHPASSCAGRHCWIHNPSEHHMVTWPVDWRSDKGTAERICPHSIGHPDPDDVAYHAGLGRDVSVHGCDGCCGHQDVVPRLHN